MPESLRKSKFQPLAEGEAAMVLGGNGGAPTFEQTETQHNNGTCTDDWLRVDELSLG